MKAMKVAKAMKAAKAMEAAKAMKAGHAATISQQRGPASKPGESKSELDSPSTLEYSTCCLRLVHYASQMISSIFMKPITVHLDMCVYCQQQVSFHCVMYVVGGGMGMSETN